MTLVRVTVEVGQVIDKLASEARSGNVQAARELREWLSKVEAETDTSVSALDRATRQRLKARLLADIEAEALPQRPERPEQGAERDGQRVDGAFGLADDEAHPADAGTPVVAMPRGSTSARE